MALPVTYAEPLALQVLGGFSCAEIARMLETSEGAVMNAWSLPSTRRNRKEDANELP